MTVVETRAVRWEPRHRRLPRRIELPPAVSFALVCLPTSLGVLLLALAFRAGRDGAGTPPYYWLGQVLLFAPAIGRLVFLECRRFESELIAVVVGVTSYVVKVAYSPIEFKFPDELQHWRTLTDLMATGNLRTVNPALPISPHFPGLELATAAVAQLTGASRFVSGIVVVGFAHVMTVVLLLSFFRTVTASSRVAAVAAVIYSANPHFQNFDAMFLYQALGIALLVACLAATAHALAMESRRASSWLVAAMATGAATAVTHHISSFVLVGLLLVGVVDRAVRRDSVGLRRIAGVFGVVSAITAVWVVVFAPGTASYFEPVAEQLLNNVTGLFGGGGAGGASTPETGSRLDHLIAYASVALLAAGLVRGWWVIRRSAARLPWMAGLAVAAAAFLAALAVRVLASDGAELYGRAMSFVFIPLSLVVAMAVVRAAVYVRPVVGRGFIALLLIVVFVGGIMTGWPPAWERVPGHYLVSGYESSVEPQGVAAATWAGAHLTPDNNLAADLTNYTLFGTYGRQNAIRQIAPLYLSSSFDGADRRLVSDLTIRYVVSDSRLSEQPPASGSYFPETPGTASASRPLSLSALRKFDHVPGASRIYDDGVIVIYDLWGVSHGG